MRPETRTCACVTIYMHFGKRRSCGKNTCAESVGPAVIERICYQNYTACGGGGCVRPNRPRRTAGIRNKLATIRWCGPPARASRDEAGARCRILSITSRIIGLRLRDGTRCHVSRRLLVLRSQGE